MRVENQRKTRVWEDIGHQFDKRLKSFVPCFSQSLLLADFTEKIILHSGINSPYKKFRKKCKPESVFDNILENRKTRIEKRTKTRVWEDWSLRRLESEKNRVWRRLEFMPRKLCSRIPSLVTPKKGKGGIKTNISHWCPCYENIIFRIYVGRWCTMSISGCLFASKTGTELSPPWGRTGLRRLINSQDSALVDRII